MLEKSLGLFIQQKYDTENRPELWNVLYNYKAKQTGYNKNDLYEIREAYLRIKEMLNEWFNLSTE